MRVGELLLNQGLVGPELLARALARQRLEKLRLCSLLVASEEVSFDDAARTLGEHFGTAAVLRRHLDGRDRDLAALLPAEIARSLFALPIGTLRDGKLVLAVRDPSPTLTVMLSAALRKDVVLAVLPSLHLERAIAETYPLPATAAANDTDDDFDIDIDEPVVPRPAAPARPTSRSLPVAIKSLPRAATGPQRDSLDAALSAFREIDDFEWMLDVTMEYLTNKWTASLILVLRDKRAVAVRGHGKRLKPAVVKSFVVDVDEIALLRLARDENRTIDEAPQDLGPDHAELAAVIEAESCPIAAPLAKNGTVTHVIVLGDPTSGDREDALVDLGLLVESMSDALSRM
jgi:hypothetical protein